MSDWSSDVCSSDLDEVVEVVHGTTVASNAILQKAGARTGLLTTAGFRDVLEIGRIRTPDMFELAWEKPQPLVPRRHRLDIPERIDAEGRVVTPLDVDAVSAAAAFFKDEEGESIAVCFLHSYRNPSHELRSVERRVGTECVGTGSSRGSSYT